MNTQKSNFTSKKIKVSKVRICKPEKRKIFTYFKGYATMGKDARCT